MSKVTIYQFMTYDAASDEPRKSRRWGTLEGIKFVCGWPMEDTATEVDASEVASEIAGLTARDYSPRKRKPGFQSSME